MNQLRLLIQRMKPKETEVLTKLLVSSRGRSKMRFKLYNILREESTKHEHVVIKRLYGDSPLAKENYRKLVKRLERDVLNVLGKEDSTPLAFKQMEHGILSSRKLRVLLANDYDGDTIQTEFESMEKHAKANQLFLDQVLLERAKCESFYLSACPLDSMERMKSVHEVSTYVTEAKIFHTSCKRYYLIDDDNLSLLMLTQQTIHHYYTRCNEPLIGFHYHAGSIILNFIRQESTTCCYHIDQLEYLLNKTQALNSGGFHDEFVLLKLLCSSLRLNGHQAIRQLLDQHFYRSFNSTKEALLERVQSKPFELDVLIRFLLIREECKTVIFLINAVVKNGLFKNCQGLNQRLDKYSLMANGISGNYENVNLILNKIQSSRKMYDSIRFYVPMCKFIIDNELVTTTFLDNLDSFRRNLRRNITLFDESGLSEKEVNVLHTIYRILTNRLSEKKALKSLEINLLNCLKANIDVMDVNQMHALVLIKWLENSSSPPSKNQTSLSASKPIGKTKSV